MTTFGPWTFIDGWDYLPITSTIAHQITGRLVNTFLYKQKWETNVDDIVICRITPHDSLLLDTVKVVFNDAKIPFITQYPGQNIQDIWKMIDPYVDGNEYQFEILLAPDGFTNIHFLTPFSRRDVRLDFPTIQGLVGCSWDSTLTLRGFYGKIENGKLRVRLDYNLSQIHVTN